MVLRRFQIVGKQLMPGYKGQTYLKNNAAIYSEEIISEYKNIHELMRKINDYRLHSTDYFSKNHFGWTGFRKSCIYLPRQKIFIPKLVTTKCPACTSDGLVASSSLTFDSKYFVCFNCEYYLYSCNINSIVNLKLLDRQAKICFECKKLSENRIMKLKKGENGYFWGCENYPSCKYTMNLYEVIWE